MTDISAICITNQFHPRLREAILAVEDIAAEIIIINTGMSEETGKKILYNFPKIKLIELKKSFTFAEQIREEVKQYAKNNYILFFDHDEIMTEELKGFIHKNLEKYDYFAIPRKNIIFGKWIRHSRWWPDYQIRLLKKDCVYWSDKIYIHVQPVLKGKGLYVEPKEGLAILHYNYQNIDEFLSKTIFYAKAEAAQLVEQNKDFSLRTALEKSLSEFVSRFFTHAGYKDGTHGFVLAFLQLFYYFIVYFYYWEKKKYEEVDTQKLIDNSLFFFERGMSETSHWTIHNNLVTPFIKMKLKIKNKLLSLLK